MDFRIIVIGASLGGMAALRLVLKALPKDFTVPVAVVLHRAGGHQGMAVNALQMSCALRVLEIEDKQPVLSGHVFIGPANYHVLVEDDHFALSVDEAVNYARPSIDVLFESAADSFGGQVIGVILTGASADGAQGLAAIKEKGGMAVVQDPGTADAPTMPEAAIAASTVDLILPLPGIGPFLTRIANKKTTRERKRKGR